MLEKLKQNLSIVALLFGIVAVAMIFCPAINLDVGEGIENLAFINGKEVVLGMEIYDEEALEFSFMGLVTFALPALGCAFLYYADLKQNKGYANFALVCFLVGAICMFCLPSFVEFASSEDTEELEDMLELGAGAIIGGISCAISALCTFQCRNEYN
jgi:hypothetical protein